MRVEGRGSNHRHAVRRPPSATRLIQFYRRQFMFRLFRALFFCALALLALIPIGIFLVAIGLPIAAALGLLALPLLLVLLLVGLPLLIIASVVVGLIGATFGVVIAFLSVGFVALKIAMLVLITLLILGWVVRRIVGARAGVRVEG